jgi:sulfide dehydrogenase cytochrome subunit
MSVKNRTKLILIASFFLMAVPVCVNAANMLKLCVSCHGEDGRGTKEDTPIISGISATVQEGALYSYANGDRDCVATPMMCKMAARLTDEQIVDLSAHYAAESFVPAGEEFDAALAEKGQVIHLKDCEICHGGAEPGKPDASILHGQRMGYLRYVLQKYAAAERKQMPSMERKTTQLTGDDIEALINFYASYRRP